MTGKITLLASALILLSPVSVALAQGNDPGNCNTMLETAIGQGLQSRGYDTSNVCNLTVNELIEIKTLLEQDGMGAQNQIKLILSRAAG